MSNTFFGLRKCSLCSASICKRRKNLKQQCEISTTDKKLSIANAKVFQHVPAPCRRFTIFRDVLCGFVIQDDSFLVSAVPHVPLTCLYSPSDSSPCLFERAHVEFWMFLLESPLGCSDCDLLSSWVLFFLVCKTVCGGGRHLPTSASEKSWCTSIFNRINTNHHWKQAH